MRKYKALFTLNHFANNTNGTIEKITQLANESYFDLQNYFKSNCSLVELYVEFVKHNINQQTNMYASITWTTTEADIQR